MSQQDSEKLACVSQSALLLHSSVKSDSCSQSEERRHRSSSQVFILASCRLLILKQCSWFTALEGFYCPQSPEHTWRNSIQLVCSTHLKLTFKSRGHKSFPMKPLFPVLVLNMSQRHLVLRLSASVSGII